MKKKGFTLIELLAVIAVLAIIALIATPIVMNTIERNRKKTAETSMGQIEKSAELYFYNQTIIGKFTETTFTCENGVCKSGDNVLELTGKGPLAGTVIISAEGKVTMNPMIIDGFFCQKIDEDYICNKAKVKDTSTSNGVITLNNTSDLPLANYKIYGNSVQLGTPSPNNFFQIENVGEKTKNKLNGIEVGNYYSNGNNDVNKRRLRSKGYIDVKPNTKYTVSWKSKDTTNPVKVSISEFTQKGQERTQVRKWYSSSITFTTDATTNYVRLMFMSTTEKVMSVDDIYEVQFEESATQTEYEPYYKIPIKIGGKNLFDINNIKVLHNNSRLKYSVVNQNLSLFVTTINASNFIVVDIGKLSDFNGKTVVFSSKKRNDDIFKSSTIIKCNSDGSGREQLGTIYGTNNYSIATISGDYTDERLALRIYLTNISVDTEYLLEDIMVEVSDNATDYEPYIEPTITNIYLNEPLRKVGDYADYIDFANKKIVRKISEKVFDGTETLVYGSRSIAYKLSNKALEDSSIMACKSSHYNSEAWKTLYGKGYTTAITDTQGVAASSQYIRFVDKINYPNANSDTAQLTAFKTYLTSQFANGTPLTVEYVLENPIEETIELPNISTLNGKTVLGIYTSVTPSEFIINYYGEEQ